MKKLKQLILYRERSYFNRNLDEPSIEDNMYVLSVPLAEEVVRYLEDEKYKLLDFVSPTTDPYNESDWIGLATYSDGVYAWDSITVHWVRKYRVRLPDEFLKHVEAVKDRPFDSSLLDQRTDEDFKTAEPVYCYTPDKSG